MFFIDDCIKALYFSTTGKRNIKFIANEITHAQTPEFVYNLLTTYLSTNPNTDSILALILQIKSNLLSNRVSFNGRQLGEEAITFLDDYV